MKEIYLRADGSRGCRTVNLEPTMCQQQFRDETDVNIIMARYMKTGQITHLRGGVGQYMDLVDAPDYQEALQTVINADRAFSELPGQVRLKFQNNPAELIAFLADPANDDEAVRMGLKVYKSKPEEPVAPPAEPGK